MKTFRNGISPLTLSVLDVLFEDIGSAESAIKSAYKSRAFDVVVKTVISPSEATREDYLLSEILSKFPFVIGINKKDVAVGKFLAVEELLRESDKKLYKTLKEVNSSLFRQVFHLARRKIESCLGPFLWSQASQYFGFGPGASFDMKRSIAQVPNKYGRIKPSVSVGCLDLAVAAVCSHSVWRDFHTSHSGQDPSQWFTIVPGNKVATVPKNAKTDRVIAIEPLMNMYVQKGIGGLIRKRLKKKGVNLNDQTSNQRLALRGSLQGELSTIDLSSASDSVSWFLCQELLPPDWLAAIENCRSPRGVLPDGKLITYRKVSSMGNGFTFELESLIFWAFCSAVVEHLELSDQTIGVYGDDLIVPTGAFESLVECLRCIGFETNAKKTFSNGPFRESCGKHYSNGSDYSPFYVRENLDEPEQMILFLNNLRLWASRFTGVGWGCDSSAQRAWEKGFSLLPARYQKCLGPLTVLGQMNDSAVGVDFDRALPTKAGNGHDGWKYRRISRKVLNRTFDHAGTLAWALDIDRCSGVIGERSKHPILGRRRISISVATQWLSHGPWV